MNEKSIAEMTESELMELPNKVTLMTQYPGTTSITPIFSVVSKEALIHNPKICFFIDHNWGYASPYDIYIASREDVGKVYDAKIQHIEEDKAKLMAACMN